MPTDKIIALRKLGQQYAYSSIRMHETIARKAGFAGTDHKYLGFFLQRGALTAGELADLTGLTTGAVTGLIDRFEEKKLVKRQLDKMDRRKVLVVPNEKKVMALLEPLYRDFQQQSEKLIATFSGGQRKVIEEYLTKALALVMQTTNKFQQ